MKAVTVDKTALRTVADAQRGAADRVRDQADAERLDTGALAPVFGLIGAGFLAALADVTVQRTRKLDALSTAHTNTSVGTTAACCAYTCCDDDGAKKVTA